MSDAMEKCHKPGCGALKRLGQPCTDWDCPQHVVSASDHRAAISDLTARLAEAEAWDKVWRERVDKADARATDAEAALATAVEVMKPLAAVPIDAADHDDWILNDMDLKPPYLLVSDVRRARDFIRGVK